MRLCQVDAYEDFTVRVVADRTRSSMDAEFVDCGALADARVRVVDTDAEAVEFVYEVT